MPPNICIYLVFLETTIIGLQFVADSMGIFVEVLLVDSVKFFYFCTSDVSAVPCHPRSSILVPIESGYATSY